MKPRQSVIGTVKYPFVSMVLDCGLESRRQKSRWRPHSKLCMKHSTEVRILLRIKTDKFGAHEQE